MQMTSISSSEKQSERGNVARIIDRLSKDIGPNSNLFPPAKSEISVRKHSQGNSEEHMIVRFSYTAQQPDELDLKEGDELLFIESIEDGWARGTIVNSSEVSSKGKIGLFPTNFVSEIDTPVTSAPITPTTAGLALPSPLSIPRSTSEKTEVAQNTLTRKESDGIVKTNNVLPSSFKNNRRVVSTIITSNSESMVPSQPTKQKELAKVLFKYEAANPDELSLPEGTIVTIINKNCEDEGWYFGECNGKTGLFPENFVKLIPNDATPDKSPSTNASVPPTLPAKPSKFVSIVPPLSSSSEKGFPTVTTPTTDASDGKPRQNGFNSSVKTQNEERKSLVSDLQSKLFPSGRLPMQRPAAQQKLGTSPPEQNEVLVEPKVTFNDPTTGILSSLVKSRATAPTRRPPSKGKEKDVDVEIPTEKIEKHVPAVNTTSPKDVLSRTSVKSTQSTLSKPLSPISKKDSDDPRVSTTFPSVSDMTSAPSREKFVTIEEFNSYKEMVEQKFRELQRTIDELKQTRPGK